MHKFNQNIAYLLLVLMSITLVENTLHYVLVPHCRGHEKNVLLISKIENSSEIGCHHDYFQITKYIDFELLKFNKKKVRISQKIISLGSSIKNQSIEKRLLIRGPPQERCSI